MSNTILYYLVFLFHTMIKKRLVSLMKKASPFICGTVILTLSNFLSRLIGFYNRIFLAGVIGAHQMGIYQLIFPVYLLGFAVCFQGFQIALSKITAEKKAAGNIDAARLVLRITIVLTLCLSPFLYFGMQKKSVLYFFMNLTAYHALDLLFLFFLLSESKTVFTDIVLELETLVFLQFLCAWSRFQEYLLSFCSLYL